MKLELINISHFYSTPDLLVPHVMHFFLTDPFESESITKEVNSFSARLTYILKKSVGFLHIPSFIHFNMQL